MGKEIKTASIKSVATMKLDRKTYLTNKLSSRKNRILRKSGILLTHSMKFFFNDTLFIRTIRSILI